MHLLKEKKKKMRRKSRMGSRKMRVRQKRLESLSLIYVADERSLLVKQIVIVSLFQWAAQQIPRSHKENGGSSGTSLRGGQKGEIY